MGFKILVPKDGIERTNRMTSRQNLQGMIW